MSYESKGSLASTIVVSRSPDLSGNYVCSGAADEVEINLALAEANRRGGGRVLLLQGTYTLAAPIVFPGNELTLQGVGRATFIDGDALTTGNHGIVLSGFTDCIMRDFSIQTQDGGTKTCHCIFIEDGADNFLIKHVDFIDSDDNCVHIEGTTINIGYINTCHIDGADGHGIYVNMDDGNTINRLNIINNDIVGVGNAGVYFDASAGNYYCVIEINIIAASAGIGIYVDDFVSGQIIRNECLLGGLSGIHVVGSTSINVTDNQCLLNERHGIFFTSATVDSLIGGNVCNDNDDHDTATYDGINLDTDCSGNIVTNNVCEWNHNRGIVIRSVENLISNNKAAVNDRAGLYVNQIGNTINDNRVVDNGLRRLTGRWDIP
jgi:parallel beta-helix repeat protein